MENKEIGWGKNVNKMIMRPLLVLTAISWVALRLSTSGNKPQLTTFGESLQQAANYQQPADTWKSGIYTSEIHAPNDVIPNHAVLSVLTVGMISRR